jgi:hypothetical protein
MSSAVIKSAFFSNESAADLEKRFAMEMNAEAEDPNEAIDDSLLVEDFVVPEKDSITTDDIGLLLSCIDETEDGDVNMGELEVRRQPPLQIRASC